MFWSSGHVAVLVKDNYLPNPVGMHKCDMGETRRTAVWCGNPFKGITKLDKRAEQIVFLAQC